MHKVKVVSFEVRETNTGREIMRLQKPEEVPLSGGDGKDEALNILRQHFGEVRTVFSGTKTLKIKFGIEVTFSEPIEYESQVTVKCSQSQGICIVEKIEDRSFEGQGATLESAVLDCLSNKLFGTGNSVIDLSQPS